jgi:[acyl-carrier-protein] S-malonyltransferase
MSVAFILGQKNLTYDPAGLNALYEQHSAVRESYALAAEWTGVDVKVLLRADDDGAPVRKTSIGLAAGMLGIADLLEETGIRPSVVGGLSLGAMVAGCVVGAVGRRDVIELLHRTDADDRPETPDHPEGCVAAVLPLGETFESFYGTVPGVWLGGDFGMHTTGAFRMLLLTGYRDALDDLAVQYPPEYFVFSEETIAVHSPLRHQVRDLMTRLTAPIEFRDPTIPLCSSLQQRTLRTSAEVRAMFSRNVVEPVSTDLMSREMRRNGARLGVVLGPTLPRDGFEFPFPVIYVDGPEDIGRVVAAVDEHGLVASTR